MKSSEVLKEWMGCGIERIWLLTCNSPSRAGACPVLRLLTHWRISMGTNWQQCIFGLRLDLCQLRRVFNSLFAVILHPHSPSWQWPFAHPAHTDHPSDPRLLQRKQWRSTGYFLTQIILEMTPTPSTSPSNCSKSQLRRVYHHLANYFERILGLPMFPFTGWDSSPHFYSSGLA